MEDGRSAEQAERRVEQEECVAEASASASAAWGTLEDILLAGAIWRHRTDWNAIAGELQSRAKVLSGPVSSYSSQGCKSRYEALNETYASYRNGTVGRNKEPESFPPWLEEVKMRRIAHIKRELERHDVNILQLSRKLSGEKLLSPNRQPSAQHNQERSQVSGDGVTAVAEVSSVRQETREEKTADEPGPVASAPIDNDEAAGRSGSDERIKESSGATSHDEDGSCTERTVADRETEKVVSTSRDGDGASARECPEDKEPETRGEGDQVEKEVIPEPAERSRDTAESTEDVKHVEARGEVVDTNAPETLEAEKVASRDVDTGKQTEVVVETVENVSSSQQAEAELAKAKGVAMVCLQNEAADARSEEEAASCRNEKIGTVGPTDDALDSSREKGDGVAQAIETGTDMVVETSAPDSSPGSKTAAIQENNSAATESVSTVVAKTEAVADEPVTMESRPLVVKKEEPAPPTIPEPSLASVGKHGIVGEQSMAEPSRPVSSEKTDSQENAEVLEKKDADENAHDAKQRDRVVQVGKKRDKDEKVQYTKRKVRDEKLRKKDVDDKNQGAGALSTDEKHQAPELKEKIDESQGGSALGEKIDKPIVNTQQEAGSPASQMNEGEQSKDSHVSSQADGPEDTSPTSRSSKKDIKLSEKQQPLLEVLKTISNHKLASFFRQKAQDPRYDRGIRRHADLNIIKARLEEGAYSSSLEFYRDMLLVFTNVIVFYPRESEEYCAAVALKRLAVEEMEKVLQTEAGMKPEKPIASRKREKKSPSDTPSAPTTQPPPPPPPSRSKVRQPSALGGVTGLEVSTSDNSKSKSASVSMTAVPSSKGGEEDDVREGEPEVEGRSKPLKAYGRKNRAPAAAPVPKEPPPAAPAAKTVTKEKPLESFAKKTSKEERPASPPPLPPAKEKKEKKDKESGKNQESSKPEAPTSSSKKAKASAAASQQQENEVTTSAAVRGARNKRTAAKDAGPRSSKRSRRS